MDQRERLNDRQEALRVALDGLQARIWTALPAKIVSFDATKVTCSAQPLIQGNFTDKNGKLSLVTMPVCPEVPVIFPHGGGYSLAFPLAANDEGLLVFASRCIDNWWYRGGIQAQFEQRMHDLSDGFFIPGPYSQPKKPSAPIPTAMRLRKDDDTAYVEIAADGTVNVVTPVGKLINLQNNSKVTGNFQATGTLQVATGTPIKRILTGSITTAFVVLGGNGGNASATIAVTGAKIGDPVILGMDKNPTPFAALRAYVAANDVVTVFITNTTTGPVTPVSTTYNVMVIGTS